MRDGRGDPAFTEGIVARGGGADAHASSDGRAAHASDSPPSCGEAPPAGGAAPARVPPVRHLLRRGLSVVAWLVAWQLASLAVGMPLILPGPVAVCLRVGELALAASFWSTLAVTLARVAAGFALAFALALLAGAAAARWRLVSDILRPPLMVLRATPIVCVIVLLLMWAGSRGVPAIAAFVVAFPPTYFAVREGVASLNVRMGELLTVFRAGRLTRLCAHVWPGVAPYVVAASQTTCSMALKAGVAAELIGTPQGTVGERIYQAKLLLETADVLAWTLVVVLVGAALSHAFVALLRASATASPRLAARAAARRGAATPPPPAGVRLANVTLSYGGNVVARALTHTFATGSRSVLAGASGTGKTTLIRAISALKAPDAGRVDAPAASVVFQDARLVEGLGAVDNVVLLGGVAPADAARALAEVLPEVDLARPVSALSGGQRRRVELVRALLAPSSAVLLDEPFASLDDVARAACCRFVLERLAGRTLVVASHDAVDARLLDAERIGLLTTRA